jgi:hypothetical protein
MSSQAQAAGRTAQTEMLAHAERRRCAGMTEVGAE